MRFPGGSIGELAVNGTVNDLAVAGARPLALSLSLVLEEGLGADELRAEVDAIAQAARDAGVEIVAGDTKVVERGHADGMYVCTDGDRASRPARPAVAGGAPARRPDPAVGEHRRARHGDHARARRVRARRGDRVGHAVAVAGGRCAARRGRPGAALHARRDPRRRRVGAQRARARLLGGDDRARARGSGPAGGRRRGRDPRDRPDVRRQRGQAGRVRRRRRRPSGRSRRCGACPGARRRRRSARCGRSRPGWCWWRRALAAGG